ncbi:hypothetical protein BDW72DRAFT_166358 [Aspergillus terricola var. indicus]
MELCNTWWFQTKYRRAQIQAHLSKFAWLMGLRRRTLMITSIAGQALYGMRTAFVGEGRA